MVSVTSLEFSIINAFNFIDPDFPLVLDIMNLAVSLHNPPLGGKKDYLGTDNGPFRHHF